jgi:hypothetical protein
MEFTILGELTAMEIIAAGTSVKVRNWLSSKYGRKGRWRKMKGITTVRMKATGNVRRVELHWYEAHGIGKVEYKIKRFLD